jgi:hypothetical protein
MRVHGGITASFIKRNHHSIQKLYQVTYVDFRNNTSNIIFYHAMNGFLGVDTAVIAASCISSYQRILIAGICTVVLQTLIYRCLDSGWAETVEV